MLYLIQLLLYQVRTHDQIYRINNFLHPHLALTVSHYTLLSTWMQLTAKSDCELNNDYGLLVGSQTHHNRVILTLLSATILSSTASIP